MKQTALEYLRGLANAYAASETVTISVATLRDALAEKQPVPSTGEMRHVAERIVDALYTANQFNRTNQDIACDVLTDAPEIIALQQRIAELEDEARHHEDENQTLYENCIRIQNENRELKETVVHREAVIESLARQSKEECEAIRPKALSMIEPMHEYTPARPNEDYARFAKIIQRDVERSMRSLEPLDFCLHGIHHHSGKQQAYDSCTHHSGQYGAPCQTCEPEHYERVKQRVMAKVKDWKDCPL